MAGKNNINTPTTLKDKVFIKSKWIHKYFGLILILFLSWMCLSGILMNHPDMISGISVPRWLVPAHYHPDNWNRSTMLSMVFSKENPLQIFAAGKQGIWKSENGGINFTRFEGGYIDAPFYKKTRQIYLHDREQPILLAAADGGLYFTHPNADKWIPVLTGEPARKILPVNEQLLVFTTSNVYQAQFADRGLTLNKLPLQRDVPQERVTLVDLFFHLHDGRVWGLPGRLLFDLAGLICFFLCVSAFYIWYFPSKWKRKLNRKETANGKTGAKAFKFLLKYHLKLGIWFAIILLIIGGTGFFMRPPVLAVIAEGSIPAGWYPGSLHDNPWEKKINNALYDHITGQIIIDATDGQWIGPADISKPFRKYELHAPVFVMGATVLDSYGDGGYLIGSFNGVYHLERATGRSIDLITDQEQATWSNVQPGDFMVTGYYKTPDGDEFISTHEQGLLKLQGGISLTGNRFQMPRQLTDEFRMPLWNYLFELHNGRFFKGILGGLYILVVPLGSLCFILITLSGVYDWLFLKLPIRRKDI